LATSLLIVYFMTSPAKVWKVDEAIVGNLIGHVDHLRYMYSLTLPAEVWKVDESIVGNFVGHVVNLLFTCTH
jgi:hypothetical protein